MWELVSVKDVRKELHQTPRACPYCQGSGRDSVHTIIERRYWMTILFIKLIPLTSVKTLYRCNLCGYESGAEELAPPSPKLAAVGSTQSDAASARTRNAGEKTCPDCAETVKTGARLCRFCGHEFSEESIAIAEEQAKLDSLTRRRLPPPPQPADTMLEYLQRKVLQIVGWGLMIVGVLLLLAITAAATDDLFADAEDPATLVIALICCYMIFAVPVVLGFTMVRRARRLR